MTLVLLPATAVLAVLIGTCLFLPLARRSQWLDTPNARSSHHQPTPSSGGLVIVPVLGALLLAAAVAEVWPARSPELGGLGAALVLCFLGAWDDRRPLGVRLRLLVQFAVASALVWAYGLFGSMPWAVAVLLVVLLVWLVNLYNFMDGIDGIAALQCVLTAGALAVLAWGTGAPHSFVIAAGVVAGSYLGFLGFNRPPALLFMGDAGSLPAGLLLGWLGLWATWDGLLAPMIWLILMSPFLLDTAATLLRRMGRGEPLGQAHRGHFYQRLSRQYQSHAAVLWRLLLLHLLWLYPLAGAVALELLPQWTAGAMALFPQLFLMAKWRALE